MTQAASLWFGSANLETQHGLNRMKMALQYLEEAFPRPIKAKAAEAPVDFSVFNLTQTAPADLEALVTAYGAGTFKCESGDWIELLAPTAATRDELAWLCENRHELLSLDEWDHDATTIPPAFFKPADGRLPTDLILWARSTNSIYLMSLWLGTRLGWAVLLLDGSASEFCCFFKSPTCVIREAFLGSSLSAHFPPSEGPYQFEPVPAALSQGS